MFIKQRILTAITKHPRILTFGIGLAVTTAITLVVFAIGSSTDVPTAHAFSQTQNAGSTGSG